MKFAPLTVTCVPPAIVPELGLIESTRSVDTGVRVAVAEGAEVGVFVGVTVGVLVGVLVGVAVGVNVGPTGVMVGVGVGVLVGVFVGVGVTAGVGVGVLAAALTATVAPAELFDMLESGWSEIAPTTTFRAPVADGMTLIVTEPPIQMTVVEGSPLAELTLQVEVEPEALKPTAG